MGKIKSIKIRTKHTYHHIPKPVITVGRSHSHTISYGHTTPIVVSPVAYVGLFIVLLVILIVYACYYYSRRTEEYEIEIEYESESENAGNYDQHFNC